MKTKEQLEHDLKIAERELAVRDAKDSLLKFIQLDMDDPDHPDDCAYSRYVVTPQAKLLTQAMEDVESGKKKRLAVSISPQTGKTQIISIHAIAWILGRNKRINIIVGTYNETRAGQIGDEVREVMRGRAFLQVFPDFKLARGSENKFELKSTTGAKVNFVGMGGSTTGMACDIFVIDDPIKNEEEAASPTFRESMWSWFNTVVTTRCHRKSRIIIVHCLTGDTPILMADGSEKRLEHIVPGDLVASYKDGKITTSKVLNWKNQGPDCLFTIRMKSGISVRANARHPFLVCQDGEETWLRTDQIKKGMYIRRVIGENGEIDNVQLTGAKKKQPAKDCVILTTTKNDGQMGLDHLQTIHKTAAKPIYDAAMGSNSANTNACSTNKAVCAQSAESLPQKKKVHDTKMDNSSLTIVTTQEKSEDCSVTGATLSLVTEKQGRFCGQPLNTLKIINDEVIDVIEDGFEDVFDIQVEGTENFIANGLVSHNTRWNEDDLIGRLCDPGHPERNKRFRNISKNWPFLNIPVVVTDPALAAALGLKLTVPTDPDVIEAFGQVPMSSLWEDKFPLTLMAEFKTLDARSFDALRMGRPSPVDGFYFKDSMLVEYEAHELPDNLRFYGASDHAVSKKQGADSSVIGCFGIDPDRTIWILPDVFWGKKDSKEMVDELIHQFITHKPALWWMEDELISKSFGPFLQDRMNEDGVYQTIDPVRPSKDKELRARSIQGRMQMQKVRFPRFAPWWPDAKKQVLKFPFGAHDDFVDWLSLIGLGLSKEYAPRRTEDKSENIIETGSIKWILAQTRMKARSEQRKTANGGW